jgi:hypothetical protein
MCVLKIREIKGGKGKREISIVEIIKKLWAII